MGPKLLREVCLISSFLAAISCSDVGYFWHVTDFHYDQTYLTDGLSCNEVVPNKAKFGDYWCDSPWSLVKSSIQQMVDVKPDVDFLIWTGDSVAHIKDANLTLQKNMEIIQNTTDALTEAFPNKTVYASLGNHDFYPSDKAQGNDEVYAAVFDIWAHWIDNGTNKELFKKGGYFVGDINAKIRVVVLNTNLYYHNDWQKTNIDDPADQLQWLKNLLLDARNNSQKVIVTGHVPVGIIAPTTYNSFKGNFTDRYLEIVMDFADVIPAFHFGHTHIDGFLLLELGDKENIPQFTAPSVTPWRYKIPGQTGEEHNPAVRLVKYDRTTGQQLDYDQYFMDLTESNKNGSAKWKKLYTFTEAYGVQDMSATSLKSIFKKMESKDSKEVQQYCNWRLAKPTDQICTLEMKAEIYCAGLHTQLPQVKECSTKYIVDAENTGSSAVGFTAEKGLSMLAVFIEFVLFFADYF